MDSRFLNSANDSHPWASAIRVDFKAAPTAGSDACDSQGPIAPLRCLVYPVEFLLSTMGASLRRRHDKRDEYE
ncbi:hypothetical protein VN12_19990 [Pirellula sp. SH-Sr6A]|uniref:hypothetical protein n=1 Tax=Pirellula sp. SH-Sr6A TaxID=1632865 RepID=UPI00078E9A95|nr:hypothetical protein [Pirellula sp. SH-Sr6A]AMV34416.1 hypothetical protein VN12_19990 [Pirellula sp. SH-Sr6A]